MENISSPIVVWDLSVAPESSADYWVLFNHQYNVVTKAISDLDVAANNALLNTTTAIDKDRVVVDIKRDAVALQNYINISTVTLPPYDVRRSQQMVDSLGRSLEALDKKLKPKKKFSFSNKSKKEATAAAAAVNSNSSLAVASLAITDIGIDSSMEAKAEAGAVNTVDPHTFTISAGKETMVDFLPPGAYVVSNRIDDQQHILLDAEFFREHVLHQSNSDDDGDLLSTTRVQLFIKNNSNCTIIVPTLLGSVRMEYNHNCTIQLGACCTSVYLEHNTSCTVYSTAHQLRIHGCRDCKLYVKVQSHPIIEDCENMGFAPYSYTYPSVESDVLTAGLGAASCWDNVVDFRWHKSTASPHWYIISEDSRKEVHSD